MYEIATVNHDMQWAIDNGWSVPPVCVISKVEGLDLSGVRMSGGDFNQQQLNAAVEKEANLHRIALITKEEMEGQTVVFCSSVASAKGVCHYLNNNYGIKAVFVYGTMPDEERNLALHSFKSGEAQVLVNCQVVAVGFDHPPTQTLILGRPTRSRSFWLQCVGRATRPLPGTVDFPGSTAESRIAAIAASGKTRFKIVDCTDATLDHRLITSVDMFLTADEDIRVAVKKGVAQAKEPLTQADLDAMAQMEIEKMRLAKEIEARRKLMEGQARGRVVGREFDLENGKSKVGTYRNPLKGAYAHMKMSELPDCYINWGCDKVKTPWVKQLFNKERARRYDQRLLNR